MSELSKTAIFSFPASYVIDLRWRELRQGMPIETAHFEGDELKTTKHYGLVYPYPPYETSELASCVTFMLNEHEGKQAWQLRGMVTEKQYQGKGFGRMLLASTTKNLADKSGIRLFWCNARKVAIKFYEKQGWAVVGPEFDIKDAGLHCVMSYEQK
ncbi:MAG: family N-acetyltransferase [Candidatus Taylorbacteria bacterium]|nr:family N-acetyltransferase [Candidatus Taylorbacteria bacterium]